MTAPGEFVPVWIRALFSGLVNSARPRVTPPLPKRQPVRSAKREKAAMARAAREARRIDPILAVGEKYKARHAARVARKADHMRRREYFKARWPVER